MTETLRGSILRVGLGGWGGGWNLLSSFRHGDLGRGWLLLCGFGLVTETLRGSILRLGLEV